METAISEVRLPRNVVPVSYPICLRCHCRYAIHYEDIDLTKWTFAGYIDIELNVKEDTDFIMLYAKELAIHVRPCRSSPNVHSRLLSR